MGIVDFIVYYIYVFIIYVIFLIFLKGVFYVRKFRFVLDKLEFGFIYFCDGLGRGGIC